MDEQIIGSVSERITYKAWKLVSLHSLAISARRCNVKEVGGISRAALLSCRDIWQGYPAQGRDGWVALGG